jgi:signal transduction histidine kinase
MEQLTNTSAQSGKRKVRLNDVVSKATSRTSLGAPKPELRTGNEEVFIEADPDRLAAIVENLIRNAQDATPSDGEILIDLEPVGTMGILRIRDSGCGMASDFIRERLFRPFDSTKGSESMGIGAYQAREYVRQIGGQLSVTSELGRGTTFSIELPLVRGR